MTAPWNRDLDKIGSAAGARAVVFRVALAVGICHTVRQGDSGFAVKVAVDADQ